MIFRLLVRISGGWWRLHTRYQQTSHALLRRVLTMLIYRYLDTYGSWIGVDAIFEEEPLFPHGFCGVFISNAAIIGKRCTIFQQVTIGHNEIEGSKNFGSPTLGDDVYLAAGAKVIGRVTVGSGVKVGANAVVVSDVEAGALVYSRSEIVV